MTDSTAGYGEQAEALAHSYESIGFADLHRGILHRLPSQPGDVLDVGAGTGRDAAALAAMGHRVLAVEPVAALRAIGSALHLSPLIEWLDDRLPDLAQVKRRGALFDVVMLSAVWMHLDADERARAMPGVAALTRAGGLVVLSLRHGPVPPGRRMFEVGADETIRLASAAGLTTVMRLENQASLQSQIGVTWTRLAFDRTS